MAKLLSTPLALALALATTAMAGTGTLAEAATPPPAASLPALSAPVGAPLTPTQQHYLSLAQEGVAQANRRWQDKRLRLV